MQSLKNEGERNEKKMVNEERLKKSGCLHRLRSKSRMKGDDHEGGGG